MSTVEMAGAAHFLAPFNAASSIMMQLRRTEPATTAGAGPCLLGVQTRARPGHWTVPRRMARSAAIRATQNARLGSKQHLTADVGYGAASRNPQQFASQIQHDLSGRQLRS